MPITQKGINKLLKHHKLDADENTDGDVSDAVKNSVSQDEMDEIENRNKELEDENKGLKNRAEAGDRATAQLVDQTLEKYSKRIGDKPEARKFFRYGLINNREETLKVLEALPEQNAAKKGEPIHNRSRAGNPEPVEKTEGDKSKEAIRASKVAARARELQQTPAFLNRHRAAFDQAETEIPAEA